MKIVKNSCFGGFSLSAKVLKRWAELQGKECYFFKSKIGNDRYIPVTIEETENTLFWTAFSVPNPNEILNVSQKMDNDGTYTSFNALYETISLDQRPSNRTDRLLIQAIEEVGLEEAGGKCAELEIVEIPDDIKYFIDEYDGIETIREEHRSW
jgi:hypothetical protein